MKYLLVVVAAIGGVFLYFRLTRPSEAFQAYERFDQLMQDEKFDDARKLASGQQVLDQITEEEQTRARLGLNTYEAMKGVVHCFWRKVDAEKKSADGKQVTLSVTLDERRGSPTMAPVGGPTVRRKQDVVMVLTDAGWMVDSFAEQTESLEKN